MLTIKSLIKKYIKIKLILNDITSIVLLGFNQIFIVFKNYLKNKYILIIKNIK